MYCRRKTLVDTGAHVSTRCLHINYVYTLSLHYLSHRRFVSTNGTSISVAGHVSISVYTSRPVASYGAGWARPPPRMVCAPHEPAAPVRHKKALEALAVLWAAGGSLQCTIRRATVRLMTLGMHHRQLHASALTQPQQPIIACFVTYVGRSQVFLDK